MAERPYLIVELDEFVRSWKRLRLEEGDREALDLELARSAETSPVIPGSGGARKMRFAPPSRGKGKRGATRVVFVLIRIADLLVLIEIYGKGERDDISKDELAAIRKRILSLKRQLKEEHDGGKEADR